MKLGISYVVFEGDELLQFALKQVRPCVDYISVVYQTTSHYGNQAKTSLLPNLEACNVDLFEYKTNTDNPRTKSETEMRNLGVIASQKAGCTHHISADVDEFYITEQLDAAKKKAFDVDTTVVRLENYFKHPTFKIHPSQNQFVTLIQKVDILYQNLAKFAFPVDTTRRPESFTTIHEFDKNDFIMHHMSYVRRDIRQKLENSLNWRDRDIEKFVLDFDTYTVGKKLQIPPDRKFRTTVLTPNQFDIEV